MLKAYYAVDKDGSAYLYFNSIPERYLEDQNMWIGDNQLQVIDSVYEALSPILPKGMTWEDEAVELELNISIC